MGRNDGAWRDRSVGADAAIGTVRSGDCVFVASACATPRALLRAPEDGEAAFVAVAGRWEHELAVGNACYSVDPATYLADVACMIHPEWQGAGLGRALQARLVDVARSRGLRGFTADVLVANAAMPAVLERSGCRIFRRVASGASEFVMLFD